MQLRVLGPVEIETLAEIVVLPRRRERCLLGVLLLSPNQLVSARRLTELLWDGHPPDGARRSLHSHVSRVRRALTLAGGPDLGIDLVSTAHGYQINAPADAVDAHRFRSILDRASTLTDPSGRIHLLRDALRLWRGPALANAASNWLRDRICADLHEQRRIATEQVMADQLALGRHHEVLPELARLVNAEPGEERFAELYMRALYQSGRTTEALEVYARTRQFLASELGLETSPGLRRLHRQIMRHELPDPARHVRTSVAAHLPPVPRQLPVDLASFAGREHDLRRLDALLAAAADGPAPPVAAITGTAGVGKTALAVHWAHRILDRFPDGQLYVNLRGFDPVQAPMEPAEAVRGFLDALGVPADRIPQGQDAQVALYRSWTAERRMFVLLDNAREAAQVRPLLPSAPGCMVVVTSRSRLSGVVATIGAHPLSLDLLSHDEAWQLLARRLGSARMAAEREATEEIVTRCGRLPLALAVTAARAATRPDHSLVEHARELREAQPGLPALSDPDPEADVWVALGVSYHALTPAAAGLYRLLSRHPGPDFDSYAAAALADCAVTQARHLLDQLLDAHLLQEHTPDRYVFHDLIRAHAAHTATTEATPQRRAALTRLFDHYLHTASLAVDVNYPYEHERRLHVAPSRTIAPSLSYPSQATAWLDAELPNLLAVARLAAKDGWPQHVLHLAAILDPHLSARGRYQEAETLHNHALTIARTYRHRGDELSVLARLGHIERMQSRYPQAIDRYEQAAAIARELDDRTGQVRALNGLGHIHRRQDRYQQAIDHYEQAAAIARELDDRTGQVEALGGLGQIRRMQGRYQEAIDHYEQVLKLARLTGHRVGELSALGGLGQIHRANGRHEQAISHYQQALDIARTIGHRAGELDGLAALGQIYRRRGQHRQATDHYRQVLDLAQELDSHNGQFEAFYGLGCVHLASNHLAPALAHLQQALDLATTLGRRSDQARAHDAIARAHHALDQPEPAGQHWRRVLDILASLGTDHAEEEGITASAVRAHLAKIKE